MWNIIIFETFLFIEATAFFFKAWHNMGFRYLDIFPNDINDYKSKPVEI